MQQVESKNCVINSKKGGKTFLPFLYIDPHHVSASELHLKVDCMIKFGLSKIGSPNILENTIHFWSAIYMHMIWPIILLEFLCARFALCLFNRQCLYYVRDRCLSL